MRIRPYTPADFDALKQLHAAQAFGYPFPDLHSPLFVTKLVLEEDESDTDFSLLPPGPVAESPRYSGAGRDAEAASREASCRQEAPADSPSADLGDPNPRASRTGEGAAHPRIVMAVLLRLTAEAYLLHDATAGTPRERWQNLLALHEAARADAAGRGLDDVQAFLPPQVARAFGRRLARLGWRPDPWTCFTRVI